MARPRGGEHGPPLCSESSGQRSAQRRSARRGRGMARPRGGGMAPPYAQRAAAKAARSAGARAGGGAWPVPSGPRQRRGPRGCNTPAPRRATRPPGGGQAGRGKYPPQPLRYRSESGPRTPAYARGAVRGTEVRARGGAWPVPSGPRQRRSPRGCNTPAPRRATRPPGGGRAGRGGTPPNP